MDLKCSNCDSQINDSNIKCSGEHFLCSKCLSRQILLQNFSPLSSKDCIELICSCKGKISIPFKECLNYLNQPEIIKGRSKSNRCFYHKEYKSNIFCRDCKKFICKLCEKDKNPENDHSNHVILTFEDFQKVVKEKKKHLRFKNYDKCIKFIDDKEDEIVSDFKNKCAQSEKIIEDTIEKIKQIKDNYIKKYRIVENNLKNIFLIIKQCYNNYYSELEQQSGKIDLPSFEFISKIVQQLDNITYTPYNFEEFEKISNALNKIDTSHYYDIKFDFKKIVYEKSDSLDLDEGVLVLCPLTCLKKSFACGTEKGKIKIYSKKDEDNEYTESGVWNKESTGGYSITSLIEPRKRENLLISGSTDKSLRVFSVIKSDNNCKINLENEFRNEGIILDIFQLSDGRIAYSTSEKKISILEYDTDTNKFKNIININNNNIQFEKCLSEIQKFEDDETNKQLISGGIKGILKRWDIYSGKLEEKIHLTTIKSGLKKPISAKNIKYLTCMTAINSHTLAIGTEEGFIIIFDYFSKNGYKIIYGHKNYINALYYSKSSNNLFSCSKDRDIKIWNLNTLKCTATLKEQHEQNINDIILCGNDLISCSIDKTINIYNIDSNENNDNGEEKYNDFE